MVESRVKDGNYYVVQSFMVKDLKLKGLEKDVYAIIYGFSQAENQKFNGSLQYLADWTTSTKQGVLKVLKSLQDKGLIIKEEKQFNGVKFCEYYTTEFNTLLNNVSLGIKHSLTEGSKQSLTNNISSNNLEDKKEKIGYQQVADMYNEICISFPKCTTLSENRKKAIKARLNTYVIDDFKKLFTMAEQSDFLKGKNDRNWNANFDWLIKDSNFAKVLDGNYNNKTNQPSTKNNNLDFDRKHGTVL